MTGFVITMMYLFTAVPHPHAHWQLQEQVILVITELPGNQSCYNEDNLYQPKQKSLIDASAVALTLLTQSVPNMYVIPFLRFSYLLSCLDNAPARPYH